MSVIFVTHDIGAAVEVSDRIAVMYAGRIVEIGDVANIVSKPSHPYTQGLLASTVSHDNRGSPLVTIAGSPPDLAHLPTGCSFAPRCARAQEHCSSDQPSLAMTDSTAFACWYPVIS
jgi:peptide/nickel transport system ATP-binding protein